jgi:acetate---CoA ligase (ADP-forming)
MVGAYIEGIKQPPRFLSILRDMSPQKPVVILKGGRTSAGTRAVVSHTSSLAGDTQIWDAVCRQAGVVQAGSLPEMVDLLLAFSYLKPPKGKRVGILGIGGGATVQAADDCEIAGLTVPLVSN